MTSNSIQQQFIANIMDRFPSNISIIDELCDVLQLSKDSVYRRVRGETALTIHEIMVLCEHYNVSFDSFAANPYGSVTFTYKIIEQSMQGYLEYLQSICTDITKIKALPNSEICYAASDIPIFYQFQSQELSNFKSFYFLKSVLGVPEFQNKKYDESLLLPELYEVGKEIIKTYSAINSTEVWSVTTVNSLIKQIEYSYATGLFPTKDLALLICDKAIEEIQYIERQSELSAKYYGKEAPQKIANQNFSLYLSDVEIGNNCIIIKMGDTKLVYITHNTFNKMITSHAKFCNETEQWFKELVKKSNLISGTGERFRFQFFNDIYEKMELLKGKIKQ